MAKTPKRKAEAPPQATKTRNSKKRTPKPRAVEPGERKAPETGWDIGSDPAAQLPTAQAPPPSVGKPPLPRELELHASADVLNELWARIESRKDADLEVSYAAQLLARGTARVAQKLGEEAVACVIEAAAGSRGGLIGKSADVLYHLLALWVSIGIRPEEVWHELHRRERASRLREGPGRKRVIKRIIGRARAKVRTTKIP